MAGGLIALLDDVAALAKAASASLDDIAAGASRASAKTLGVIIDDAAVTPQYVGGLSPQRELPIIWRITKGSLRNKIVFILPASLLLATFTPWALPFLLILGGSYLCFEGAHKIVERLAGHSAEKPAIASGADAEDTIVSQAVRTDFILSAEIMVIALNEVSDSSLWHQLAILLLVASLITALVYGVVALIVKTDDAGLALSQKTSRSAQILGRALLAAMPWVMRILTVVGTIAMLWVGGHIIIAQLAELHVTWPLNTLHHLITPLHHAAGSFVAWLADTGASAVVGLIWGTLLVGIVTLATKSH